jgi:hypothetical protein
MSITGANSVFEDLDTYLSACRESYKSCLSVVDHQETISGVTATTRMHHIKFDGNGRPMIEALAESLYRHVVTYCIAARNRQEPLTEQDRARINKEARKYFVHPAATQNDPDQTGEAGECLLYLLMEVVLNAPQVVAKMELKTNPNLEVNGSDGIHMSWNAQDELVDIFFGEAKLYQNISSALDSAFKSIEAFHAEEMYRHEFAMVTKHFKHAPSPIKDAVVMMLKDGVPNAEVRINHACLIGYDWEHFAAKPNVAIADISADFQKRYAAEAPRLHKLLQARFDSFARKHLHFEIFFLPFPSVQELRTAFNKALA